MKLFGFRCFIGNDMPTIYIYNLFNSSEVPFHVIKEACVVCFLIKPLVSPYLREIFIFDNFLI